MVNNLVKFASMTGVITKIGKGGLVQCKFQHAVMAAAMKGLIAIGAMGQGLNQMSEDCQSCGTAMFELDAEGLCPRCNHYNWEEQDYSENKLFYENDLEQLEELPTKEKM